MRFLIAACGAALLCSAPVHAALYQFDFMSEPLEYIGPSGEEDDFSAGGNITSSFVLDLAAIENADFGVRFGGGEIFPVKGGELVSGAIDGYDVRFSSVLFGSAFFQTDAGGALTFASAGLAFDTPDYSIGTNYARVGSSSRDYYGAPGEWTVTALDVAAVPLPASAPLLLLGIGALAYGRRRAA